METDQPEQQDVLLNPSMKVLSKNCETEKKQMPLLFQKETPLFNNKDTQTEIVMAEKSDTSSTISGWQSAITGTSKSIIEPQNLAPVDLEIPEDQLEKGSISPRQEGVNSHLATGAYTSLYCSTATPLSGILDCFPSGNPVMSPPSLQEEVFIDQTTGDIYTYDQPNKLFISIGYIDQNTAADLQQFLKVKDQKQLNASTTSWTY